MIDFNWVVYQQNISFLGMQGSGKTTLAKKILDTIPSVPRLIISPQKPLENYGGYGTPIDKISDIQKGAMIWTGDFSQNTFERICNTLMARCSDMVLLVDDVHEFCSKQKMPSNFNTLIQSGRNRGICGMYLSPSANLVNNYILQSCQHIFAFKMKLHSQIEWLEKNYFGNDAEILIAKDLRNPKKIMHLDYDCDVLPKYSFLYRDDSDSQNQLYVGDDDD